MQAQVTEFRELEDAILVLLGRERKPDISMRAKWGRRFLYGIDRTLDSARRAETYATHWGLLAAAAVSLLEGREYPEGDEMRGRKIRESKILIARAREAS